MKIIKQVSTTLLAVAVLGAPLMSMAGSQGKGSGRQSRDVDTSLDTTEIQHLNYMREEEKLARDVYRSLYGIWGLPVFDNISESEQVHTTQVEDMLDKYRLPDPVVDDTTGVFVDQVLIDLYADLIELGSQSSLKALYVGAAIEEIDMIDLQLAIDETDNADIQTLYEDLMSGSKNHLRAYVGQIENLGIVYEAQYLPQDEVDSIVDSPVERGR
ncbi:MAG TPA: hypothetical protein DDW55_13685 [Gammaproteobacteria bacterium]|nr:hypothetical protein [Gammaproteobacteria bacterium]